jgi:hypothetical protein
MIMVQIRECAIRRSAERQYTYVPECIYVVADVPKPAPLSVQSDIGRLVTKGLVR